MRSCPRGQAKVRLFLSLSTLLAGIAGRGAEAPRLGDPSFQVRIRHAETAAAVTGALRGATRRLTVRRCEDVTTDFEDVTGRPLREVLDGLGQTGAEYLGSVLFYDGTLRPCCSREGIAACTVPASRVVFICPAAFRALRGSDKLAAEVLLIHEMLHSLGLGEDPPSSWQITQAVNRRCR